jgi:hypothetical protein
VHPGTRVVRDLDALGERVERAGVQVAGLQRDDERTVDLGNRRGQGFGPDPALLVGATGVGAPSPR